MSKVHFFTPVELLPRTHSERFEQSVENYFSLGGRKVRVLKNSKYSVEAVPATHRKWATALKIISYFTVLLPLFMLIAKAAFRCKHPYHTAPKGLSPLDMRVQKAALKVLSPAKNSPNPDYPARIKTAFNHLILLNEKMRKLGLNIPPLSIEDAPFHGSAESLSPFNTDQDLYKWVDIVFVTSQIQKDLCLQLVEKALADPKFHEFGTLTFAIAKDLDSLLIPLITALLKKGDLAWALTLTKQLGLNDPLKQEFIIQIATAFLNNNDLKNVYSTALLLDREGKNYFYPEVAKTLAAQGDFAKAAEIANKLILDDEAREDVYVEITKKQILEKYSNKAHQTCQKIQRNVTARESLFAKIVELYMAEEEFSSAIQACCEITQDVASRDAILCNMAKLHIQKSDCWRAYYALEGILQDKLQKEALLKQCIQILLADEKEKIGGIISFVLGIEQDIAARKAYLIQIADRCLAKKYYEQAIDIAIEYMTSDIATSEALIVKIAEALFKDGSYSDAESVIDRIEHDTKTKNKFKLRVNFIKKPKVDGQTKFKSPVLPSDTSFLAEFSKGLITNHILSEMYAEKEFCALVKQKKFAEALEKAANCIPPEYRPMLKQYIESEKLGDECLTMLDQNKIVEALADLNSISMPFVKEKFFTRAIPKLLALGNHKAAVGLLAYPYTQPKIHEAAIDAFAAKLNIAGSNDVVHQLNKIVDHYKKLKEFAYVSAILKTIPDPIVNKLELLDFWQPALNQPNT